MAVTFFRHSWGAVGPNAPWATLAEFVWAAAEEGYEGVEVPFGDFARGPAGPTQTEADFHQAIDNTGLKFLPLIQSSAQPRNNYAGHLASLRGLIERAAVLGATFAPIHAGDDSFDDATAIRFFREADQIARDVGLTPYFETHRGRPMYNPWRTAKILEALPTLQITADFGHWIPVLERLPADLEEIMSLCVARTGHIHTRVGHEEGGQVPDPRDPIWAAHLHWHESYWDQCVASALSRGDNISITPEYGPFPFLLNQPNTATPLANLAEIVSWTHIRLRQRYAHS